MNGKQADPHPGRSRVAMIQPADLLTEPANLSTRIGGVPSSEEQALSGEGEVAAALDERFERKRLLGMGGVGSVYLARDRVLQRDVALKVLQSVQRAALPTLLDEARATSRVRHPNVVALLDAGVMGQEVFVAFEYVEGQTLRSRMKTKLAVSEALRILHDIAAGLAAAHAADVLHLDVKPENIMLGADRRARVIDFGLARTRVGATCVAASSAPSGTPAYMAPELWAGEAICDGTDVWSFAVLAYEMLAGRRPYEASNPAELMVQVLASDEAQPPALVDVDPELAALLAQGLRRFRGARPFMRDLEAALARAVTAPHMAP